MKKPERKTRILAVGDIHGDSGLVKKLAQQAKKENIDLVILAGDLTLAEMEAKNLISPFLKVKKQVLLIPGNHESPETVDFIVSQYENAKNIHGYALKRGDLGIFGAGTVEWDEPASNTEIFRLLKQGNNYLKDSKRKVMVTHMHPRGSKSEIAGFKGSKAIRRAIKEFHPDVLISAHIHETGGIEEKIGKTRVINVSRKPTIFEI